MMKTQNNSKKGNTPEKAKSQNLKVVKLTEEDLLKKIEALEKKLNSQPQSLEEKIKFFEVKKQRINNLNLFEKVKLLISESLEEVTPNVENEEFETKQFRLTLSTFRDYGEGTKLFSITNPLIIQNSMSFIIDAIDKKIIELKHEIEL